MLKVDSGLINIDGINSEQVSLEWWKRQLIAVPQEPHFINGSILQNLLLFNENITNEDINNVVDQSGLRDFISQTDKGINLEINNLDLYLSLGIKKRISLARSLLSNGRVLIFDEPTEGLDQEGSKLFIIFLTKVPN